MYAKNAMAGSPVEDIGRGIRDASSHQHCLTFFSAGHCFTIEKSKNEDGDERKFGDNNIF